MALQKQKRLIAKEVALLFSSGVVVQAPNLALRYLTTNNGGSRAAVIVPVRVVARAEQRNKLRRQIVHVVHKQFVQIKHGFIFVVVVKRQKLPAKALLEREVLTLLEKSGILNK